MRIGPITFGAFALVFAALAFAKGAPLWIRIACLLMAAEAVHSAFRAARD